MASDDDALDPRAVAALDEAGWLRHAYRGDQPQLTTRAIASGLVLGFALSCANVYVGLKTGWFLGMALTACLLSVGAWRLLAALGLARTPLGLLEANCVQSTASSAAFATGNMVVGVLPALLLLSVSPAHPRGVPLDLARVAAWIACVAALGVTIAIPIKRQLIDRERLPFPSGTAAAITLHGLHRAGRAARARVHLLVAGLGLGAVVPLVRDLRGVALLAPSSRLFDWLPRRTIGGVPVPASELGLVLDHGVVLAAAGAFVGRRTTAWMLVGGLVTAYLLGPLAIEAGAAHEPGRAWAEVGVWIGAPLLVGYAIVALLANLPAIARAVRPRGAAPTAPATPLDAAAQRVELPRAWFRIGFAVFGGLAIVLGRALFGLPVALGALGVALSLLFAVVAGRVTGETDLTPGGPIAKVTQLVFGALRPQPPTGLVAASLTHGSAVACADLLNDLKCGRLLGADPRRQVVAQAIGIVAGTAASVLAYALLVPDASALLGEGGRPPAFAAPAAHQFRAVATLLQGGLGGLPPLLAVLAVIGGLAGVALSVLERQVPATYIGYAPSAAGLGLGLLLPASTSLAMLLGALIAGFVARRSADASERTLWPVAAGLLAGESLAGVAVAMINHLR